MLPFLLNLGDPIGERIATNNLVDISNNKVRNTIMAKYTARNESINYMIRLRKFWDLWKAKIVRINKKVEDVQKNYRKFLAKKKLESVIYLALANQIFKKILFINLRSLVIFEMYFDNKFCFLNLVFALHTWILPFIQF